MALRELSYVDQLEEIDPITNQIIADKTVTCWAFDFQEFVGAQNFPVKGKKKFYTKLVEFLNTGSGKAQLFRRLGIEYSSLIKNPDYIDPAKARAEARAKGLPPPPPNSDPKTSVKYFPPTDAKMPNVKFTQLVVRADYNPRHSRA